jgi:hypothetical protein
MMFAPLFSGIDGTLQLVVPLENPVPPRLFDHVTAVTPRLSDDVPPRVTTADDVEKVDEDVGPRMLMLGGDVSEEEAV